MCAGYPPSSSGTPQDWPGVKEHDDDVDGDGDSDGDRYSKSESKENNDDGLTHPSDQAGRFVGMSSPPAAQRNHDKSSSSSSASS